MFTMRPLPFVAVAGIILVTLFFVHPVLAQTAQDWIDSGYKYNEQRRFLDGLQAFDHAISLESGNKYAWTGKSEALNGLGRNSEALAAAETALAIDPNFKYALLSKGGALASLGRIQEAMDTITKALTADPGDPFAWTIKSNILNQMGKSDEALQAAEKALAIDSTKADIWNSKGFALLGLGRNQEALDTFNKALGIDQNNKWSILGRDEAQAKLGKAGLSGSSATPMATESVSPLTSPVQAPSSTAKGPDLPSFSLVMILAVIAGAGAAGIFLKTRMTKGTPPAGTGDDRGGSPAVTGQTETTAPAGSFRPDFLHHDIFISYSSEDKPTADAICAALEAQRIRCWIAPRDVLPGENFPEAIIHAIEMSRIMVLVFSSHSNTSGHVMRELTKAVSKGVIIIPFRIEDIPPSPAMEYLIGVPHWLDALTPPLELHIQKLARTVTILLEKQKSDGTGPSAG